MPTYTPVDHDPFASAVPAQATYTPVDFDPFAQQSAINPLQQAFEAKKSGLGRTVLDQSLQGGTFGFGDEVSDAAGAVIAKGAAAMSGNPLPESISQLYDNARQTSKQQLGSELEQRPYTSFAANLVGGGIATGGLGTLGAGTRAGQAVGNFVRGGNLATRISAGAVTGATSGGLYGAGMADEGSRMEGAANGSLWGGGLGAAFPVAGAAFNKLNTKTIVPRADEVRQSASALYKQADELGGTLKPEITNNFIGSVNQLRPQTEIGQLVGGESEFSKIADRINAIKDKPMTLQAAQEVDEFLGDAIQGQLKEGKLTKEGYHLQSVQNKLRDTIENAGETEIQGGKEGFEALKQGRQLWATSQRMRDIERIVDNAQTFQVPATAIKTGFRQIVRNPGRFNRYSPEEQKAIKRASETGLVTDILNIAGSRLGPIISGASGYAAGGPLGGMAASAGSYMLSSGARKGAEALQTGRANQALQTVAGRSNLPKAVKRIDLQKAFEAAKKLNNESGAVGDLSGLKNNTMQKLQADFQARKSLPTSEYLSKPNIPTKEQLDKLSRIEEVPLSAARTGQNKMDWDKFDKKDYPGALIEGYENNPVAVKLENGEYIIFDGNHRTTKGFNEGKSSMKMHVINAKDYDAMNAGRKSAQPTKEEIDYLLKQLMDK